MKKILLLTTGGTIACEQSGNGLAPEKDGAMLLRYMDGLESHYDLTICDLMQLDSTNMQPEEWQAIATKIFHAQRDFDAVIVTHGTDTLAFTSSVLSYMLLGVEIPVVLTASQLPMTSPLTDAVTNLRCAFAMAETGYPGVFVAFDRQILLGCRCVKVRTSGFHAFESINYPPVGIIDSNGLHLSKELLVRAKTACSLREKLDKQVFLLKLIPGINPEILPLLVNIGCHGVVIEAFGAGGISSIRQDLVSMLSVMADNDIPVVVCSQCLYDSSDLSHYEVGRKALEQGAISARDMTSEATVTKLMWGLGQMEPGQSRVETIRRLFAQNLAGEVGLCV